MKKFADVFTILYIMVIISGIACYHNDSCKSINDRCSEDCECCYQKCTFSFLHFRSFCRDNTNAFSAITSLFGSKNEVGNCTFNYSPENQTTSDKAFHIYGLNAAHARLLPDTRVQVTLADKKLILAINDGPPPPNGVILALSREAAEVLNIDNGVSIPCKVFVPSLENSSIYKFSYYIKPYIDIFKKIFSFIFV